MALMREKVCVHLSLDTGCCCSSREPESTLGTCRSYFQSRAPSLCLGCAHDVHTVFLLTIEISSCSLTFKLSSMCSKEDVALRLAGQLWGRTDGPHTRTWKRALAWKQHGFMLMLCTQLPGTGSLMAAEPEYVPVSGELSKSFTDVSCMFLRTNSLQSGQKNAVFPKIFWPFGQKNSLFVSGSLSNEKSGENV